MLPSLLADVDAALTRGRPLAELLEEAQAAGAAGVDLSAGSGPRGLVLGAPSGGERKRGRIASRWSGRERTPGPPSATSATEVFAGSPAGRPFTFSVAVHDGAAAETLLEVTRGAARAEGLSLRSPDLPMLARLARSGGHGGRLVHVLPRGLDDAAYERHAATLAHSGLGGLRMPWQLWSRGLTTLFGKFGLSCEADGARGMRHVLRAQASGVDRVSVADLDHLTELATFHGAPERGEA